MTTGERSHTRVLIAVAIFIATMFAFLVVPEIASAQIDVSSQDTVAESAGFADASLTDIIGGIIAAFLGFLGIIALVIVIYAGFLWMTAGGNVEQIAKAKKWLINGVVGLLIILSAYAITNFVINFLEQSGLIGGGVETEDDGGISIPPGSGALGDVIEMHYPPRNATDVARNTMISITFKESMLITSFINGYDDGGTPADILDDDDSGVVGLNTDNILIYPTAEGEGGALESDAVRVAFTEDLETFVFYPEEPLGSALEDTNYTVVIGSGIENVDEETVLTINYDWSFEVGTEIDLTPPTVRSVVPVAGGLYDRNIVVEVTFDEAVDPTSATGSTGDGFTNIRTEGATGGFVEGVYEISNQYRTVTFTSGDACGTNSCGETIYCLPGLDDITVSVIAATPGETPPQVETFPYDGIVDTAANALDGNGDGEAGDDYQWDFETTNDINLDGPIISTITPDYTSSDEVALDQPIVIAFEDLMMTSSLTTDNLTIHSRVYETGESPAHELWYSTSSDTVEDRYTETELKHGVLLESGEGTTYQYRIGIGQGIKNQYQNCYDPANGPGSGGGSCGVSDSQPWCCNGTPQASACPEF